MLGFTFTYIPHFAIPHFTVPLVCLTLKLSFVSKTIRSAILIALIDNANTVVNMKTQTKHDLVGRQRHPRSRLAVAIHRLL